MIILLGSFVVYFVGLAIVYLPICDLTSLQHKGLSNTLNEQEIETPSCKHRWLVTNPHYKFHHGTADLMEETDQVCKLCGEVKSNLIILPGENPQHMYTGGHRL